MPLAGRPTDHANIDLGEFNRQVVCRRAGGRILWQPRIGAWYTHRKFLGEPLPEPYTGMSLDDLHRSLNCSNRLYRGGECFRYLEDPRVIVYEVNRNDTDTEIVWETPVGKQREVRRRYKESSWFEHLKWPISTPEELKVATWRARHADFRWVESEYRRLFANCLDLGIPTMNQMPRNNIQTLYLDTMGVEAGVTAIFEYRNLVEDYFDALNELSGKLVDEFCKSPIEVFNLGDNLHGSMTPPDLFKRYIQPIYLKHCEKLHTHGKFVISHWDGDAKPLLQFAQSCGLDGIEAITPEPQGDVTLEETREALGDKMFLFDGIPAVLFDETYSIDQLVECAHRVIELFAPNLVLGISDEMSARGDIERIRIVGEIVDDYNASLPAEDADPLPAKGTGKTFPSARMVYCL